MIDTSSGTVLMANTVHNIDVSIWGLFWNSDVIVQAIMLLLLGVSIWSWTIVFAKWSQYRLISKETKRFEDLFFSSTDLEEIAEKSRYNVSSPMVQLFLKTVHEWEALKSKIQEPQECLEKVDRLMTGSIRNSLEKLESNLGFLATVGSTAPFVGLFGTVWGIMHSFQSIAASKNTSLAVVAPGIAEALFATALGLIAAIPAVIAYNKLSTFCNSYASRLENFADELIVILRTKS